MALPHFHQTTQQMIVVSKKICKGK